MRDEVRALIPAGFARGAFDEDVASASISCAGLNAFDVTRVVRELLDEFWLLLLSPSIGFVEHARCAWCYMCKGS